MCWRVAAPRSVACGVRAAALSGVLMAVIAVVAYGPTGRFVNGERSLESTPVPGGTNGRNRELAHTLRTLLGIPPATGCAASSEALGATRCQTGAAPRCDAYYI